MLLHCCSTIATLSFYTCKYHTGAELEAVYMAHDLYRDGSLTYEQFESAVKCVDGGTDENSLLRM
jgi:hypothetical protein